MKRAILLVTLILVLSAVPATVARHKSVGVAGSAGVSPDDEPSVPDDGQIGQDTPAADTPYEVGTTSPADCYDARGEVSQEEVGRAGSADGFCGALRYNEDLADELEVVSPKDQDIPSNLGGTVGDNPIDTFDVVRADSTSTVAAFTLCLPFCKQDPGGDELHTVFYDTASQTGLTNDSETTEEEQRNNRRDWYYLNYGYANAGQAVQAQTGLWEMNGWANPSPTFSFVGYLLDDGEPISKERLEDIVGSSSLDGQAGATICGFTADFKITISGGSDAAVCELPMRYSAPEEDSEASFTEYGDRCQSPTYLCGEVSGAQWHAFLSLHSYFNYMGAASTDQAPLEGTALEDLENDNNYREWHWVVGPAAPSCPVQEPGFATSAPGAATAPYLAHDLDVYTPSTRIDGAAVSTGPYEDYAVALSAGPTDTVQNSTQLPPAVEEAIDQTLATANGAINETNRQLSSLQNQTIGDTSKNSRMEPNAEPTKNPLSDTSSSQISVSRAGSLGDSACARALTEETPDTLDPWVDRIDSGIEVTATQTTLYGNADPNQDDENNPGPDRISTEGNVGLFTDKNDDGNYDTTNDQFTFDNILATGAYAMVWDVYAEKTDNGAQITGSGACQFGADNDNLALEAQRIGYGPNTGVFQLVYLQEPTTADTGLVTQERVVYSSGNNIYLMGSQAVKTLWEGPGEIDPGVTGDFPLDNKVDSAIQALQSYADGKNGESLGEPQVKMPGDEFGLKNDFSRQCEENTGGFDSRISFTHDCQAMECSGDTVLTQYVFQVVNDDLKFDDDGKTVSAFHNLNDVTADFGGFPSEINTWTDVDPLDGDPDRNDDGTEGPPTGS